MVAAYGGARRPVLGRRGDLDLKRGQRQQGSEDPRVLPLAQQQRSSRRLLVVDRRTTLYLVSRQPAKSLFDSRRRKRAALDARLRRWPRRLSDRDADPCRRHGRRTEQRLHRRLWRLRPAPPLGRLLRRHRVPPADSLLRQCNPGAALSRSAEVAWLGKHSDRGRAFNPSDWLGWPDLRDPDLDADRQHLAVAQRGRSGCGGRTLKALD